PKGAKLVRLREQPDYGTLALSVLDEEATGASDGWERFQRLRRHGAFVANELLTEFSLGENLTGALATHFTLKPGETREVIFLVTWDFAGGERGRNYGNWFPGAVSVARYLREHLDRLTKVSRL